MKAIKKHDGDLRLTLENVGKYKTIKEVSGNLIIDVDCNLPALTSVGGYLYIYSNASLPALTSVGGHLYIYSNASLQADALTSVGGHLDIYSNASLQADALTSVGGHLGIYSNASLPALTSVGGHLDIYSNASLQIPSLKSKNWRSVDNHLFVVESEKTSKGINILSGYNVNGIKKNKHVKEVCYVAEKDGFFAHGESVKKAISDLNFKIVAEKLKNEPINEDTDITVKHYRLITGACDFGVRSWMTENGIKYKTKGDETIEVKPIKAKDLLPILRKTNAYGLDKIEKLITF